MEKKNKLEQAKKKNKIKLAAYFYSFYLTIPSEIIKKFALSHTGKQFHKIHQEH